MTPSGARKEQLAKRKQPKYLRNTWLNIDFPWGAGILELCHSCTGCRGGRRLPQVLTSPGGTGLQPPSVERRQLMCIQRVLLKTTFSTPSVLSVCVFVSSYVFTILLTSTSAASELTPFGYLFGDANEKTEKLSLTLKKTDTLERRTVRQMDS